MDFAGGVLDGSFYLKNCGFFNNYTIPNTVFKRKPVNKKPDIDLSSFQ